MRLWKPHAKPVRYRPWPAPWLRPLALLLSRWPAFHRAYQDVIGDAEEALVCCFTQDEAERHAHFGQGKG